MNRIRRKERQSSAKERKQRREKRSPQEQLALLDRRLGKGVGARKERARLKKLIKEKKERKKRAKTTS